MELVRTEAKQHNNAMDAKLQNMEMEVKYLKDKIEMEAQISLCTISGDLT